MISTILIDQYVSDVQDAFIEELGDDFDFYINQDVCLAREQIEAAIEKGISPRDYVDSIIYGGVYG